MPYPGGYKASSAEREPTSGENEGEVLDAALYDA
jgi:hypothetical protein